MYHLLSRPTWCAVFKRKFEELTGVQRELVSRPTPNLLNHNHHLTRKQNTPKIQQMFCAILLDEAWVSMPA